MIRLAEGNLLDADVDALVNTVNTVGIMGKGIALQFKRAYPAMFKDYARAAKSGDLHLGRMHTWETGLMTGPRFVINFPTKKHWRSSSRLGDIERGLDDLVVVVKEHGITSIAVPPLGCGHGGLDWADVEPLIRAKLAGLGDVDVQLFAPAGAPAAEQMPDGRGTPPMTPGRAALVEMLARYSEVALDASLVETQKLMYFLQEAGEPLKLHFAADRYGPYADSLRAVLREVEGHYLTGFGDGSAPVMEAAHLDVLPGARDTAAALLATREETNQRIHEVMELVAGFESAYSLELLSTVHWIVNHPNRTEDAGDEAVVDAVRAWSPRKGRMFTPEHIRVALTALRGRGWAATPA